MEHVVRLMGAAHREFLIDNLLVRIYCIIVMIRWTGLVQMEHVVRLMGAAHTHWEQRITDGKVSLSLSFSFFSHLPLSLSPSLYPASRHGSLNSLFQVALYLPSWQDLAHSSLLHER